MLEIIDYGRRAPCSSHRSKKQDNEQCLTIDHLEMVYPEWALWGRCGICVRDTANIRHAAREKGERCSVGDHGWGLVLRSRSDKSTIISQKVCNNLLCIRIWLHCHQRHSSKKFAAPPTKFGFGGIRNNTDWPVIISGWWVVRQDKWFECACVVGDSWEVCVTISHIHFFVSCCTSLIRTG